MTIFQTNHINLQEVKKSKKWFDTQVASMKQGNITPNKLMTDKNLTKSSKISPGNLYFFFYDPKGKDVLPFYDTFPMVFPYKAVKDGFLGLNLHYLGYPERFALFKKLLSINGSKIHDDLKLKYSWSTVSAFANVPGLQHCVKHYLYNHVRSPLMKVQPNDWTTSMLLPVEQFVGAKKEYVWSQSRKK